MPTIDVHQHLWPQQLIEVLARREQPPRLRDSTLELAREGVCDIDVSAHRLEVRLDLLDRLGVDIALVSLQPTIGFDDLPEDEARELVAAYEEGILETAAASGGRIVPLAAGPTLDGFAGACVSAGSLSDLDRVAPLLDDLARRGAFLFVHPGPPGPQPPTAPSWWSAVVDYTAQMQAAYAVWLAAGAKRWPDLEIVFAILAGGGPFQLERLRSRGVGGRELLHESVFFETSSYGNRALELCLATFGVGQLLFGSDVPVLGLDVAMDAVRGFGDAVKDALCDTNPTRLLA